MAGKLDARAKLIAAFGAILIVSSTPPGDLWPFAAYLILICCGWMMARIPAMTLVSRLAAGSLFLVVAAVLLLLSEAGAAVAASVLFKGLSALAIVTLLTETTPIASILWAMRKLGAPRAITLISAIMLRFVWMLFEEFGRMSRARASRCGGTLAGELLFRAHGAQAGLLLVRSWERADRIYNGMLARGFTGEMPETHAGHFGWKAWVFTAGGLLLFVAARYFLANGTSVVLSASMLMS